jgi:AraC-like DNA-binding protein
MIGWPDCLIVRPILLQAVAMFDPLSDVLRAVRLTGGVFLDVRLTAPWCVISELTADDCRPFLANPAQLIFYHVVLQGGFLLRVEGEPPVEVKAGEVVLLPRNDVHTLATEPGLTAVDGSSLVQPSPDGRLARIRHGGGGEETHMVCGFLGSEEAFNPLLSSLPRVLRVDLCEGTARDWVEASVRFAAGALAEGRLASSDVMSRLSEVLLVEAVRAYGARLDADQSGWFRGLGDPQVGRALVLIHRDISARWTAEELAREVGLSRSAFVERFSELVGLPPIRYLGFWRLQAARQQLRETRRSVAQIAYGIGYGSEEAFSRAFKREFGISPARWRGTGAANRAVSGPAPVERRLAET